ncbi:MAG: circularly permuted type 2 ATP-grasp protein [Burkholderiaceae bacterium]
MNAPDQPPMPAFGSLLDDYRTSAGVYDELIGPDGRPRPSWRPLLEQLADMNGDARARAQAYADDQLREHDVTFRGAEGGDGRPWRLDLMPFTLSAAEWAELEAGLVQRARLLDALVGDSLGPQHLLVDGVLPPPVFWRGGDFPVACQGLSREDERHLHLLAFDLARDRDGRWRVLRDRVGTPDGLGYALENRIIVSRCLPDAFDACRTRRVADFFRGYNDYLIGLTGREDSLCLVMVPGAGRSSDYFEHAFIGRYLGYGVVHGSDLTVRDARVLLKTVEGLKPVDLLLRRVPTSDCDPLELRVDSGDGVAGLMQAVRAGRVVLSNRQGSEIGENPALAQFLPAACQRLLGERLEIASLESWWCGQPEGLARALDELETLRVQRIGRPNAGAGNHLRPAELDPEGLARLRDLMRARPQEFVVQRLPEFSVTAAFDGRGRLQAVPLTIRLYLAATPDGYRLMPGGLARSSPVGVAPDPLRLPNAFNKDIWVGLDEQVPGQRFASLLDRPLTLRRSDRNLASRTADHLFWLGNYLERAEGATRLFRALFNAFEGDSPGMAGAAGADALANLLVTLQHLSPRRARRLANQGRWMLTQRFFSYVFDADSSDGLVKVLGGVARNATMVRERLSPDLWRVIERLCQAPSRVAHNSVMRADYRQPLNDMIESFAAINGMIVLNMTRANGWRFLETGRRLERIRHLAKLIGELAVRAGEQDAARLGLLLDLADCTITYRSRYRSAPQLVTTLDLLISDASNPRALIHQVQAVRDHVEALPMDRQNELLSPILAGVLRLEAALRLADLDELDQDRGRTGTRRRLVRLMETTQADVESLIDLLTSTYFNHAVERRVGGQDPVVAL